MKFFSKTVLALSLCCLSFHVWGAERRTLPQCIEEFTKQYRGMPVPEKGARHFQPLPKEAKNILLAVPFIAVVSEEGKQERSEGASAAAVNPLDESFPQNFQRTLDDPLTNVMDTLTCFLQYAISRTPDWTPDDRILMKFLSTNKFIKFLSLDPDVYTPRNSLGLLETIFLASREDLKLESLGEEVVFFPVCTDIVCTHKLFPPGFLTRWAIENVFLVLVPKKQVKFKSFSLSPLGQMIHNITHGLLAIHEKTKRFKSDLNSVFNYPQFPMMTLSRRETFQKDLISFFRQKNTAFEQALVGCLDHLEKNDKKMALSGLFLAVRDEGISSWPAPGGMGGDLLQTLGGFLGQAQTPYTEDPFQTSPKDGNPKKNKKTDFAPCELGSSSGMAETTLTEVRPHGPVSEIKLADGPLNGPGFFVTQQWLVQNSGDVQKMIKYLQMAQYDLTAFLTSDTGYMIKKIFTKRITAAQSTFLGQTKNLLGNQALIQAIVTGNIRPKPEPHTHG